MMLFLNVLLLLVGFVALIKGADFFVDGSSSLAKIFKVPGVIIGLTIVALGTSLPELAVSTSAALRGANEIAVSNVTGSNLFNILCVLGFCSLFHRVPVNSIILKRDFPVSIAVSLVALFASCSGVIFSGKLFGLKMADNAGLVSRWLGILLLVLFVSYIFCLIYDAKKNPVSEEETSKVYSLPKSILLIIIGVAMIIAGGQAVVNSARIIARTFGMTETLIGLTVVAIGTSLPELVTSIVAARKGEVDLAVGNVVGSNIFNLLFILGVSSTIHPVKVNAASVYDFGIMIIISILAWVFSITNKSVRRAEGIFMILTYAAITVFAILR
ncbi:cation:H+ antiporter [Treponema rectale]|uniref:Cation:H+ antiporter n=1 Tax=Treponema rectale TaxID=744512 RepID=A0A840SK02_9SPIR|nr:calcium/sodium antiporter [Treponema rectale]MBB5219793.1 cation:H+ antiporter [Treponema rectale]